MPAILTNNFSVVNAENFVNDYNTNNDPSYLYLGVGRGYQYNVTTSEELAEYSDVLVTKGTCTQDQYKQWVDEVNKKSLENNPPTPEDTEKSKESFREDLMMVKRVQANHIFLMVPRVNWEAGRSDFSPIDASVIQGNRARNFYCYAQTDCTVWLCVSKTSGAQTVTEPSLASASKDSSTGEYFVSEGGYKWKFLYDLTSGITGSVLLDDWVPVPFGKHGSEGSLTENQKTKGDINANRTLSAYHVLVSCSLEDETDLEYGTIYRQIGLLSDPLKENGERLLVTSCLASEFDKETGELIYLENKKPIMRSVEQIETLDVLLIF